MAELYGGVETGGTWVVCAAGTGPGELRAQTEFRTAQPRETIEQIVSFFAPMRRELRALGVGSFGPVDLRPGSATWGHVTSTPKPGWRDTALGPALRDRLGVPVAFETDVGAAAVAEHRWGAARGLESLCYVTVGTGIGAGVVVGGRPLHGLVHPEPGHLRIPHDRERDPFDGVCELHGDCWEGLASGPAIAARWGEGAELPDDHEAWSLVADYVALGLSSLVLVASPERIVLGGGVMARSGLLGRVRGRLRELIAGYLRTPLLGEEIDRYLVAPELGEQSGVLGAIALAQALER